MMTQYFQMALINEAAEQNKEQVVKASLGSSTVVMALLQEQKQTAHTEIMGDTHSKNNQLIERRVEIYREREQTHGNLQINVLNVKYEIKEDPAKSTKVYVDIHKLTAMIGALIGSVAGAQYGVSGSFMGIIYGVLVGIALGKLL